MKFCFALVVLCPLIPCAQAQFVQQGPKLVGTGFVGQPGQGYSVSVSRDGNTAIVGGPGDDHVGAAWVFVRSGSVWTQQGDKLVGTGAIGDASQGASVSISGDGNTALLGAPNDNNGTGAAWVFTRSGGVWAQQGDKLVGMGAVGMANQGRSVAISGDGNTAIVGGPGDDSNRGAGWVFTRSGGVWTQQAPKLVGTGAAGVASQGTSLALSGNGNTALVGGPGDDNAGATWVFTRSAGMWTQQGPKIVGGGLCVALSGDGNTAVIGPGVWVFTRSGSMWTQQGPKLVGTGEVGLANQGTSVAVSEDGNTLIEGGPSDNNGTGAAWVFTRSGGVWAQQGNKLVGVGAVGMPYEGRSVAVSGDANTIVLGGYGDNNIGAAWVFAHSWKTLTNTYPGGGTGPCLLLTDGTVACNSSQQNSN